MAGRRGRIGFLEAYSIGVGGMIGGGIFAVLGLSLELSGGGAPMAFLFAGLIALVTAYSYARLSVRYPSEGGTVEYLVRAYGTGLLAGGLNVMLLASYIVMIALYSYAFGSYAAAMLGVEGLRPALSVAAVALFAAVNALGAVVSGKVEDALVLFKLAVLLLVAAAGLGQVDWGRLSPESWPDPLALLAGGMIIFLAYEGFELVANASRDVEDPRVIPRALYAAVATVIAVYFLVALVAAGTLTPEEVRAYRDYALAAAARPSLGELGFILVGFGAVASTSSAINATLYGTARISYVVAKYGYLPRAAARRLWRGASEGLAAISLLAAALAALGSLEGISVAGSGGFLIIFTAVNLAAYRLRGEAGASPLLALAGTALTSTALAILVYRAWLEDPRSLAVLAAMLLGSFAVEAAYRALTGRRLREYIDEALREREERVASWRSWLPRLAGEIARELRALEVYLVGSVARGELHRAHDVDLLVVAERALSPREARERLRRVMERLGLDSHTHPVDLHLAAPEERDKWLRRSGAAVKLHERRGGGSGS